MVQAKVSEFRQHYPEEHVLADSREEIIIAGSYVIELSSSSFHNEVNPDVDENNAPNRGVLSVFRKLPSGEYESLTCTKSYESVDDAKNVAVGLQGDEEAVESLFDIPE